MITAPLLTFVPKVWRTTMPNINFIASAGTGKTYSLIEEVTKKIISENITLKEMMILTFSEKAATEIKDKIGQQITQKLLNPEIPVEDKVKLHRQLIFLDSSHIGTFHSVFLKILKRFPEISGIDNSYQILKETDIFLSEGFELFVEKDYNKDSHNWSKIISLFGGNFPRLKNVFITLYNNRLKLSNIEENSNSEEIWKQIDNLTYKLKKLLQTFKENYPHLITHTELFNVPLHRLEIITEHPAEISIKEKFLIKRNIGGIKNMPESKKNFYYKDVKPLFNDEAFKDIERDILNTAYQINLLSKDYNARTVLQKFYQFSNFINNLKKEEKLIDFNDILEKTVSLVNNPYINQHIKNNLKYIFVDEFQDTDLIQTKILKALSKDNIYLFGDPKQCIYTWREADLNVYFRFLQENNFQDVVLDTNYRSSEKLVQFFNEIVKSEKFLSHIDKKFKTELKSKHKLPHSQIKLYHLKTEKISIKEEARFTAELIKNLLTEGYNLSDIFILFFKNEDLKIFRDILSSCGLQASGKTPYSLYSTFEVQTVINILKVINNIEDEISLLNVLKSPLILMDDIEIIKQRSNLTDLKHPVLNLIKQLSDNKHSTSLRDIVNKIYEETDLLRLFSLTDKGYNAVKNLNKFRSIAEGYSLEGITLPEFLNHIENSKEDEADEDSENSIKLLTMHKSKGLESKVVIIPLLNKNLKAIINSVNIVEGKPILKIDRAVSKEFEQCKESLKQEIINEWERLFYVAITRAKEKLFFISSGSKVEKNSFYSMLISSVNLKGIQEEIPPIQKTINVETVNQTISDSLIQKVKETEEITKRSKHILSQKKPALFVSVSKIMEKEEDNYSGRGGETAVYVGILTHSVLENINLNDFRLEEAKAVAQRLSSNIPENIRETILSQAIKLLEKYPDSQIDRELKTADILFKEFPFVIKENGRFIEGRIDLIYQKGDTIYVMDFKTNRYETEEEKTWIINQYEKQKEYYLKAVSKLFPDKKVIFRLGLLWKGEVI